MTYETRYVIVAGIAWIRRTRVGADEHVWLVVFGDGEPQARKGPAGESSTHRGELDGVSWRVGAGGPPPPLPPPPPPVRPVPAAAEVRPPRRAVTGGRGGRPV